ncbi:MAG TPA: glycosyltransferase family 2 protein [Pirellulaceae bacterium]|nr:glycosyltransferase family 2 protein [Pirellulaceae bacterium]HMO91773.1 glycosyltransferase family 2 protein [Pirellulaceae bacterium]HMP69572.1 glycosyltransferase family 2 protein [Pirellulaceae bacterium]
MRIDIVIPVYNEEASLQLLWSEISQAYVNYGLHGSVIFVDDGSDDGSWSVICALCDMHREVVGVRLNSRTGKSGALLAGFSLCQAEYVVMMDADLQDDPRELHKFVELFATDVDLICGWKKARKDPWSRRFLSRGFNQMINLMTGLTLHDHNCGFKGIRRSKLIHLDFSRGMHRFFTVMISAADGHVVELVVNHRPRKFGRSKYGWGRIVRGFCDFARVMWATRLGKSGINRSQLATNRAGLQRPNFIQEVVGDPMNVVHNEGDINLNRNRV